MWVFGSETNKYGASKKRSFRCSPLDVLWCVTKSTVVDVLVTLNSLINAKHAIYQKCQRKKHFSSRSITCRVEGIPTAGCG